MADPGPANIGPANIGPAIPGTTDEMQLSSDEQSKAAASTPAVLVLGMAGSGKSTLTAALQDSLDNAYFVNLDPAVTSMSFSPNVDIRDSVNYKSIMSAYSLGPNGAILTCLNLFATRFEQVLSLLALRSAQISYIILDTPGQIETFTWSASGDIISSSLALQHPTIVLYVIDTVRSAAPLTFMSNMLYACSIMYKTRLPMILVFTKSDACTEQNGAAVVRTWLEDFDAFEAAIGSHLGFRGTLARSMGLALSEFYEGVRSVAVSAVTGDGLDQLVVKIKEAVLEFDNEYRPVLEERKKRKAEREEKRIREEMERLKIDRRGEHPVRGLKKESDEEDEEEKKDYLKFVKKMERLKASGKIQKPAGAASGINGRNDADRGRSSMDVERRH